MNFLAHLYLSAPDEDLITGGFLGDFVKGPLRGNFSQPLENGIQLHRHIDGFTDRHLAQKRIKQKLPDHFSRYSGIVADMMCDYFLSKHWYEFHTLPIERFNQECMATLLNRSDQLPNSARIVLERMDQQRWLTNYDNLDHIAGALSRIGLRMRYANPLNTCKNILPTVCNEIEADCLELLRDTEIAVTKWRASNTPETAL